MYWKNGKVENSIWFINKEGSRNFVCFKFLNYVILVIDVKFVGLVIKICL